MVPWLRAAVPGLVWLCLCAAVHGQTNAVQVVDFGRDVLPLFRTHCFDCHGPDQQLNGLRLDRREDALQGGTTAVIGPGSSAASRLYLKLIGDQYGSRMPPDGPLSPDEIETIKRWIDQGASWPDDLAGSKPATVPDPRAVAMMRALRDGDLAAFQKQLRADPGVARTCGAGGTTPLMYAALYADAESMQRLLDAGADVNHHNDACATALMWALEDVEKTRLLLEAGGNPNWRSEAGRTPLLIATANCNSGDVVQLLLNYGADPSVLAASYRGPVSPLRHAAEQGDSRVLRLLLEHQANVQQAGLFPWMAALNQEQPGLLETLEAASAPAAWNMSLVLVSPPFGNPEILNNPDTVRSLIRRGADVNARDPAGRTPLMLAAALDTLPVRSLQVLLEHGAEVRATATDGRTAMDFARQRGRTEVVELLERAGGQSSRVPAGPPVAPSAASPRAALQRSIPLLQRAGIEFLTKSGCVSCHHNSLTSLTVAEARRREFPVDESVARDQQRRIGRYLDGWKERVLQNSGVPGDSDTISYLLLGLAAERYPADATTDALARFLKNHQSGDGSWPVGGHRPPLESSRFQVTAASLRGLQVYGMATRQDEHQQAVRRAAAWLADREPRTTEDRAFQLLGLCWSGQHAERAQAAAKSLVAQQQADGGWSSLASLPSDAYATGQALVALHESGMEANDPFYQRGVQFLLRTQQEDGSWWVPSRSLPFQPYFESGFPHGPDQWISVAATNWSSLALLPAAEQ